MDPVGALVSYSIGSSESSVINPLPYSTSGIKFGGRWVLTHGSLISPLKAAEKILNNQKIGAGVQTDRRYKALPTVYVSYEGNGNAGLVRNPADNSLTDVPVDGRDVTNNIVVSRGRIKFLWKCGLLAHIIDTIFTSWTIGHKLGDVQTQDDTGKAFLSVFVLIDIGDPSRAISVREALTSLLALLAPVGPRRGQGVLLQGTPFSAEVLLNSLSRGLACSCLGEGPRLILCDASTTLGCEGGPAFLEEKNSVSAGRLFGMTLNSLSWNRGEWVGLSLVACLAPPLRHLLASPCAPAPTSLLAFATPRELPILAITDIIDSAIVLVRCGESWGSGVVMGKGYILTCSHVVHNHDKHSLSIFCKGKTAPAKLIFKTPNNKVYDLALLHSDDFISSKPLEIATEPAVKGETVIAAGFPYFSERHVDSVRATITKGSVTNASAHMVQTSCCVQSGCSGGAILRVRGPGAQHPAPTCQLLGLIVCNTIDETNNTKFPNVNMAVPATVFQKPLNAFMLNPSSSVLNGLEEKKKSVQSLWKLQLYDCKL